MTSVRASLFLCVHSRRNSIRHVPTEIDACQVVLPDGRLARSNLPRRNALASIPTAKIPETQNYSTAERPKIPHEDNTKAVTLKDEVTIEKDFQKDDLEDFQLKDVSSDSSSGYSTEENQNLTIRLSGRLPVSNFGMTQYITKSFYIAIFSSARISQLKIQMAKG